jgi:mannose/fructose/N-acetylgalactosamine-specific phosphotransferase system component IIB
MIALVRVDDRLVHGQITVGWVPYLHADRVAVVNDRIASNPVLTAIVRAGGAEDFRIDVLSVSEAARLFGSGDFREGRAILLFESLQDVRDALLAGMTFDVVNLGGVRGEGDGVRLGDAVFLTKADRTIIDEIAGRGVQVEMRLMPRDRPVPVTESMGR